MRAILLSCATIICGWLVVIALAPQPRDLLNAAPQSAPPPTTSASRSAPAATPKAKSDATIHFERDIAPIFQAHCIRCHGAGKQESGLRLDDRAAALRGGDNGRLLVTGKSSDSELIKRITSTDDSLRMPPSGKENKPLSAAQIATLRKWIDEGADWPQTGKSKRITSTHWAYQPLKQADIPQVKNKGWVKNPIDAFVLAQLEKAGYVPSPEADRPTLLKRLSFDLLGLLPTPEEVDTFVNDGDSNAYEKQVDRLLRSPHFGERWGRHWLDVARYADSDGYEKDNPRPDAWRYRDWVIDAINKDLPFDEFTRQQIAGDLLPGDDQRKLLATAFHRQTLTNTEGGTDQEQWRVEAVIDRVNTTGTAYLGLTVGCAQCHTHKYDAITQAEYYQLFAFYNNGDETTVMVDLSDAAVKQYEVEKRAHDVKMQAMQKRVADSRAKLAPGLPKWEQQIVADLKREAPDARKYHPLDIVSATSDGGVVLKKQDDGSYLATGKIPNEANYTLTLKTNLAGITGFRLDALTDKSLGGNGPGRTPHGNFVLTELRVADGSGDAKFKKPTKLKFSAADATHSQGTFPPVNAFDDNEKTGWAIAPKMGTSQTASFYLAAPVGNGSERWLRVELSQRYGGQHTLGRFRLMAITGTKPGTALAENVRKILETPAAKRTESDRAILLDHFASLDASHRKLVEEQTELERKSPAVPRMPVRVLTQRTNSPRVTRVLRRGDFLQPMGVVEPALLAVLPPVEPRKPGAMPDRLDLANWLVDARNPLTPRVTANQVWSKLFGRGIVRTLDDFGVRGERPTHPELLDWLALEYQRLGWSRKAFIKRIVMSNAYRQSSRHRADMAAVDPLNNLFYRQNRIRVEAEIVRDLHLSASGLLSRKIGGPSVFPPMPADVAALSYAGNFRWKDSQGEDRFRRGMYTFFKRTSPHPGLITFDCPDSVLTAVERRTSNTPLQALMTLNNMVYVEAARGFAARMLELKLAGDQQRLTYGFRIATSREPTAGEIAALSSLLAESRAYYTQNEKDAKQLAIDRVPKELPHYESAAWIAVGRIILNMDEFITRE